MKILTVTKARVMLGEIVEQVHDTRKPVVITKHGGKAVLVVPYDEGSVKIHLKYDTDDNSG